MNKNPALAAAAVLCVAGAPTAAANEIGFYVGGYVGQMSKDAPRAELELLNDVLQEIFFFAPVDDHSSLDEKDVGFALIAGYRLFSWLAIEGGYTNLGKVTYRSRGTGNFPMDTGTLAIDIESETSGFATSVLGTWPVTRDWEVFGRVGAVFANNKLRIVIEARGEQFVNPQGDNVSDSFSQSTTETYAGIGISRRFLDSYDVRLEYQRVFDAGLEITGGKSDLDAAMLGVTVTF